MSLTTPVFLGNIVPLKENYFILKVASYLINCVDVENLNPVYFVDITTYLSELGNGKLGIIILLS